MPEPTVWVAADSRCGHPVAAFGDREQLERQIDTVLADRGVVAESEPGDWPEPAAPGGEA